LFADLDIDEKASTSHAQACNSTFADEGSSSADGSEADTAREQRVVD
jgi:hypothetical protein